MKYTYYPGCSLERNAAAYHQSTTAVAPPLGMDFQEIDDWNCCGATEFIAVDKMTAYALTARNLALAAKQNDNGRTTLVAPCSACFLNLSKCDSYMSKDAPLTTKINDALDAGGLQYEPGTVTSKHLLDVIVNDVGYETVAAQVEKPLYGLKLAPYYGCLLTRPSFQGAYDDPEYPTTLDKLLRVLGAEVVDYPVKAQCCGGHMTQISEEIAMRMIRILLKNAIDNGADAIVATCPMCQLNLDAYQHNVNSYFGTNYQIPIIYFTQLMGVAFGMDADDLGFGQEFVSAKPALAKINGDLPKKPRRKRPSKQALPMPIMPEEVLS